MSSVPWTFQALGTQWQMQLYTLLTPAENHRLFNIVQERIAIFEQHYSRFLPGSWLTTISRNPGTYVLPDDAKPLLDFYYRLYQITNGVFTPLIGETLVEAGYDATYSLKPGVLHSPATWDQTLIYSYPHITIKKPLQLDFGGLGKGYVVDIISALLRAHDVQSFYINAGGDIYYQHAEKTELKVGLEHPDNPQKAIGIAQVLHQSICSSSGNRRAWDGFHHIIHPHSLASPRHILATWAVANDTLLADAMATCLFLVPSSILTKEYQFEYLIVYADYSIEKSSHFPAEIFTS